MRPHSHVIGTTAAEAIATARNKPLDISTSKITTNTKSERALLKEGRRLNIVCVCLFRQIYKKNLNKQI